MCDCVLKKRHQDIMSICENEDCIKNVGFSDGIQYMSRSSTVAAAKEVSEEELSVTVGVTEYGKRETVIDIMHECFISSVPHFLRSRLHLTGREDY